MTVNTSIHPPHTPWRRLAITGVGLAAIVCVVIIAFLWPTVSSSVKSLPIGIAGDSASTSQFEHALETQAPGTFRFVTLTDRTAAVTAIRDRTIYGAIVLEKTPEVLTASAASPVAAQMLASFAPKLQEQLAARVAAHSAASSVGGALTSSVGSSVGGAAASSAPGALARSTPVTVPVVDIVPLASSDARGAGLAASGFPLVLGGMLGGVLISLLLVGVWRRLVAVLIYAVVAGFGLAGILWGWFGVLQGDYIASATAISLGLLSISGVIVGFASLFGRIGTLVGPVVYLLIGNPLSSAAQPMEFLASPWGVVGQWFPPGAAATLLRDLSYFPDARISFPWLVLGGWAAVGLAATVLGHLRNTGAATRAAVREGTGKADGAGVWKDFTLEVLPVVTPDAELAHHPRHAVESRRAEERISAGEPVGE